jgi:hypothetical protein
MGSRIEFENGGAWYGVAQHQLQRGVGLWTGRTPCSAANGNSLLVVSSGTALHFAHSVQAGYEPFGTYLRIPVEPRDLNALVDAIDEGRLDGGRLVSEQVVAVGQRLGIMRTLTPPAYPLVEDRVVPYYVAVGQIRRDRQALLNPCLAIWPEEWDAFCAGAHLFRCRVVSTRTGALIAA